MRYFPENYAKIIAGRGQLHCSCCSYHKVIMLAAASFLAVSVCFASSIQISNAWVRKPPPDALNAAAYLSIMNNSATDIDLLRLSSPAFRRVEIHQTILSDGMTKMRREDSIKIKANTLFELKPGGYHLMLIDPCINLEKEKELALDLHFSGDEKKTILLPIRDISNTDLP